MQRSYYGRPKTITLAKTWPNETGYVTQRNTWHCEKLRDVALTNLTQRNTWMKRDARKSTTWSSENGTFRGENTLRYDSQWHCEKLCDVAHSNVTQRNIWIKREATKPAAWFSENITLRSEKYVTLRQHYIVSKIYVGQHGLESMASLLGVCNILSHRVGGDECDITRNPR